MSDARTAGGLCAFAAAVTGTVATALPDPRNAQPGAPAQDLFRGGVEVTPTDPNAHLDLAVLAAGRGTGPSGPTAGTISGGTVTILAGAASNTGDILATGDLSILAGSFVNEQPTLTVQGQTSLEAGGTLARATVAITTLGDLVDVGGRIRADGALTLAAGGSVQILTQLTPSTRSITHISHS